MTERSTDSSFSRGSKLSEEDILHYNRIAMDYLRENKYDSAMNFLKQAYHSLKQLKDSLHRQKLFAITFNNLGCFFKRTGQYKEALSYLFKAVEMEKNLPNEFANIAGSHLNICAILSMEGEHERALRHALKSLYLLKNNFNSQPGLISTLIIAYHNVGSEYEHLLQFSDAADCYRRGWELSKDHLGLKNQLTNTLKKSFVVLTERMKNNGDMKSESQSERKSGKRRKRNPRLSVPPPKEERLPVVQIGNAYQRAISHEGGRKTSQNASLDESSYWRNIGVQNRQVSAHEDNSLPSYYQTTRASTSSQNTPHSNSPPKRNIIIANRKPQENKPSSQTLNFRPKNLSEKLDRIEKLEPTPLRKKKINLLVIKAQERTAAVMIQSWWRMILIKRNYAQIKIDMKLKEAEQRARKAVEEFEKLKRQAFNYQKPRADGQKSKIDKSLLISNK